MKVSQVSTAKLQSLCLNTRTYQWQQESIYVRKCFLTVSFSKTFDFFPRTMNSDHELNWGKRHALVLFGYGNICPSVSCMCIPNFDDNGTPYSRLCMPQVYPNPWPSLIPWASIFLSHCNASFHMWKGKVRRPLASAMTMLARIVTRSNEAKIETKEVEHFEIARDRRYDHYHRVS